ncbi:MAG TPA: uracil-DNA glycosylase [Bacteroidota bacterium]|nr:uracil-DNA glycosylase [Bacteroidota bacterium]
MDLQKNEIAKAIESIERYFQQYKELYSDEILIPSKQLQKESTNQSMKPTSKIPNEVEPEDLFGMPFQQPKAKKKTQEFSLPQEPWTTAEDLDTLNEMIRTCTKCSLGASRKNFVFGVGNPQAEVVVVGEAPGADEDEQGKPFVGRAGQLLNKILEAIHFHREEVFICNILKCRPPNNREPLPEEITLCEPYLVKQLEILHPKAILCAGRIAGQALLKTNTSLAQLRGKVFDYRGIPLMVTYHPAALLRNPNWKRLCWEDVQRFRKLYDELKQKEQ